MCTLYLEHKLGFHQLILLGALVQVLSQAIHLAWIQGGGGGGTARTARHAESTLEQKHMDMAASVQVVTMPGSDLSASWLRERLAAGKSLRFLTPKAVEAFIAQHAIYGSPSSAPQ